jgi:hypothetical protein
MGIASYKELIEHWGMPREDIQRCAVDVVETARAKNRPKCSDRHQYDCWTRTMVAVIMGEGL